MKKFYGWIVIVLFGLMLFACIFPSIVVTLSMTYLAGCTDSVRRSMLGMLHMFWGKRIWEFVHFFLRIDLTIDFVRPVSQDDQFIVIANHRTALDHVMVSLCAALSGIRDIRWVLKKSMRRAPVIGWLNRLIGSAFLSREHDPGDLHRLNRTAGMVREDGASVMIYPEGTRFKGVPKPNARFGRVLEPKLAGFKQFVTDLPEHHVLNMTLDWGRFEHGITFTHVGEFIGRSVRVRIADMGCICADQASECLNECWIDHENYIRQGQDPLP